MNLNKNAIPQKTKRGQREIVERRNTLAPSLRWALLIVDGEKSFEQLFHLGQAFGGESSFVQLLKAEMIEVLSDYPVIVSEEGCDAPVIDLHSFVIDVLQNVYGTGIVKEVEKISKKFPPETHGVEFLNACSKKAMMLMNKDEVDKLLKPAYNAIDG